jgi:hypothetical protein
VDPKEAAVPPQAAAPPGQGPTSWKTADMPQKAPNPLEAMLNDNLKNLGQGQGQKLGAYPVLYGNTTLPIFNQNRFFVPNFNNDFYKINK